MRKDKKSDSLGWFKPLKYTKKDCRSQPSLFKRFVIKPRRNSFPKATAKPIENPDTQMFDLAMTCLCFKCDKCLQALSSFPVAMDPTNVEEIEFCTVYA